MKYGILFMFIVSSTAKATTVCGVQIPSQNVDTAIEVGNTHQVDIDVDLAFYNVGGKARACKNGATWAILLGNNEGASIGYPRTPKQAVEKSDSNRCSIQPTSDGLCVLVGSTVARCFASEFPGLAGDYRDKLVAQRICDNQ